MTSNRTDFAVNSKNETVTSNNSPTAMIHLSGLRLCSTTLALVSAARLNAVGAMVSSAAAPDAESSSGGWVT